jgi:hypothetical protein
LTVGGDRLDYSGNVVTSTADITTFKILINSTLSTEDATVIMMDIKNWCLGTPLPRFEYMKMLLSRFPDEIVQKYHLNALAVDGWVYIEIRKDMYGLKQVGLLANKLLQARLAPWTLVASHSVYLFHTCRGRFYSQVRGQAAHRSSQKRSAENLPTDNGLGRNGILRHKFKTGLQKQDMRHFLARLRFKRAQ